MKNILGKNTSLTILRNNIYTPLCYTEETIRQSVLDYPLPATIGKAERERWLQTGTRIEGCFVSRLDEDSAEALFDVVSEDSSTSSLETSLRGGMTIGTFTLLINRVFSKNIFTFLKAKAFELRADNGGAFYFRLDVGETRESRVEEFSHITPVLKWNTRQVNQADKLWEDENGSVRDPETEFRVTSGQKETFLYDGKAVLEIGADGEKKLHLIYRFELVGDFSECRKLSVYLCHALSDEFFPVLEGIGKIVVPISRRHGMFLEIGGLKPTDDTTDVRVSDEVLVRRKFRVSGAVVFVVRNRTRFVRIEL